MHGKTMTVISDTVLYASIYDDWKDNKTTPIKLDEVPY